MSSTTPANASLCASELVVEMMTAPSPRINCLFGVVITSITFLASLVAVRQLYYRSIFHNSTRLLLYVGMLYANIHELVKSYNNMYTFYRSVVFSDSPCEIIVLSSNCRLENNLIVISIAGMVLVECALSIDRITSTFVPKYFSSNPNYPGIILSVSAIVGSILIPVITFWGDGYEGIVDTCMRMPAQSAGRANILLRSYTIVNLFNIAINVSLLIINKKQENSIRFNMSLRYQSKETLVSTRAVCIITIAQFVALAVYSLGVLIMRTNQASINPVLYNSLIGWVYAVPYAAVSLPLLVIFTMNRVGSQRRKAITVITHAKETQDSHMRSLQKMWETA